MFQTSKGFATLNADTMTVAVLQKKMRHRSFQTTLRYISLSDKMKKATENVYEPEFFKSVRPTELAVKVLLVGVSPGVGGLNGFSKRRNPLIIKGL